LLACVVNSYMGKVDKLTPEAAFGMTASKMGQRVLAFAKHGADCWQPRNQ